MRNPISQYEKARLRLMTEDDQEFFYCDQLDKPVPAPLDTKWVVLSRADYNQLLLELDYAQVEQVSPLKDIHELQGKVIEYHAPLARRG